MNDTEEKILVYVKDLSSCAPLHVDKWRALLEPMLKKAIGISNLADQLRSVTNASIEYMENFKEIQEILRYNIVSSIEEDLKFVRDSIEKLSRINALFKDKLDKVEHSSLDLDWEEGQSQLLQGSPLIPPLGRFLSHAFEFYTFFNKAYKNMQNCMKTMDWLDENNMKIWEESFIVNLNEENVVVNYFIALTQYVNSDVLLT